VKHNTFRTLHKKIIGSISAFLQLPVSLPLFNTFTILKEFAAGSVCPKGLILFLWKRLNSLSILVQILNRFCQKKEDYELHLTPNLQYKRELLMQFGAPENTNGTDNFPKAGLFPYLAAAAFLASCTA
jgi:hypothetical protein